MDGFLWDIALRPSRRDILSLQDDIHYYLTIDLARNLKELTKVNNVGKIVKHSQGQVKGVVRNISSTQDDSCSGDGDSMSVGVRVSKDFNKNGISCAIGGSLAYGLWGVPRATMDVDMNVFINAEQSSVVFEVLDQLSASYCDNKRTAKPKAEAIADVNNGKSLHCIIDNVPVDMFFNTNSPMDLPNQMETRCKKVNIQGHEDVMFLDAESITICKLLWCRDKDIVDLRRLFAIHGAHFDFAFMEGILSRQVSDDDRRMVLYFALKNQFGPKEK